MDATAAIIQQALDEEEAQKRLKKKNKGSEGMPSYMHALRLPLPPLPPPPVATTHNRMLLPLPGPPAAAAAAAAACRPAP